jgi:hypothetical protein
MAGVVLADSLLLIAYAPKQLISAPSIHSNRQYDGESFCFTRGYLAGGKENQ